MKKLNLRSLVLSLALGAGVVSSTGDAHAAAGWVRNLTILAVSDVAGHIQINIVKNGTIEWVSLPNTDSRATRLTAAVTAAWLAGKKLDVYVDQVNNNACGSTNSTNCELLLGWMVHN